MARRRITLDIVRATELRAQGRSWDWLGEYFGVHPNTIQDRLDPGAKARREARSKQRQKGAPLRHQTRNTAEPDQQQVLSMIPADDRSVMERFFGDPIPRLSAAGKRVLR